MEGLLRERARLDSLISEQAKRDLEEDLLHQKGLQEFDGINVWVGLKNVSHTDYYNPIPSVTVAVYMSYEHALLHHEPCQISKVRIGGLSSERAMTMCIPPQVRGMAD
jgi:hypothetical protein